MRTAFAALAVIALYGCGTAEPVDVEAIQENLDVQLEGSDLRLFVTGIEASGDRVIVSTQLGQGGGTAEAEAICGNVVAASYTSGDNGVTSEVSGVDVRDASGATVASCEPRA
jgi:hypothetical protein